MRRELGNIRKKNVGFKFHEMEGEGGSEEIRAHFRAPL
jgi:hypothetical protein